MSNNKKYSTNNLPNSAPIFVTENSIEAKLLDPKYYRIIDKVAPNSSLRIALPSTIVSPTQVTQTFTTRDKVANVTQEISKSLSIQLDDISITNGPTDYMEGTNKKYEVVFKILNSSGLDIKDVEYRITEI